MTKNQNADPSGFAQIPRGWRGWARKRAAELRAGGVSTGAAHTFAEVEARGRAAIAASLGEKAALAARLAWIEEGGGKGRFVLAPGAEKPPRGVVFHTLFAPP